MSRRLLAIVVSCLAVGCADEPGDPTPEHIDLSRFEHPAGIHDLSMAAVVPASAQDYVAFREARFFSNELIEVIDEVGTPCATAGDVAQCTADLAAPNVLTGFHHTNHPDDHMKYVVANAGDSVLAVEDDDQMRAFLAPIDNRDELLLMVAAGLYYWSTTELGRGAIREVDGGWEVIATRGALCPADLNGFLLFVSTSGAIEIRDQWVIVPPGDLCS